ncbi:MAG: hypothetical protein JSS02_18185 [Planctomycetes bacterium]|nr:hypothetical protein [Planctomycetota bacterium]
MITRRTPQLINVRILLSDPITVIVRILGRKDIGSMESEIVATTEPQHSPDLRPAGIRRRTVLLSLVSLAAGIGVTRWIDQVRYERFQGFLQARYRNVVSVRDAEVVEILVSPGEIVTAGQPIVRLKDSEFQRQLEAKRHEIESLELQLAQCQAKLEVELDVRRQQILDRIFDARLKAAQASRNPPASSPAVAAKSRTNYSQTSQSVTQRKPKPYPTIDRSVANRTGSKISPASAQPPAQLPQSEFDLCTRHIEDLERMNRELPEKISRMMGVDLAQAHLDHARAELATLESQERQLTLTAETSGLVGVLRKNVGDHVTPYESIVQLLDEEQPYLGMQIPSSRIADFPPGTLVSLVFPGKIAGKGRVVEVPPQTSAIADVGASGSETRIGVHIEPVGTLWPNLPFGSVVEVRRQR